MLGNKNHNNGTNNGGNDGNHTSKWRWLALLLLLYVFLCLVVIHVANYVYLRHADDNGTGLGSTGYSATTPIFQTGIAEFVSLGFLILPLVLSIVVFSGWWDYRTAVVANVFAIIDFIVILFVVAGVITVRHLDNNNAYGGVDYCNYVPQHTVFHTNTTAMNVSTPILDVNGTVVGFNFAIEYITQNYTTTSDDVSGSEYIYAHHYCKGQTTLLAGVVALLFGMLLTWFLTHLALNGARRHANTTVYQTTQTTYAQQAAIPMQTYATTAAPAQQYAYDYPAGAHTATTGIPAARSAATLNNV